MAGRSIAAVVVLAVLLACAACSVRPRGALAGSDRVPAAREFVQLLGDDQPAQAVSRFDETMKRAMPAARLQQMWQSLEQQQGSFRGIVGAVPGMKNGYDIVDVTCEFAKGRLNLQVVFNADGRIGGLWVQPASDGSVGSTSGYEPPSYVHRDRFEEREVTVGERSGWDLPGTLTVPKGDGPFPALVLVHGSGPNDRDETLGPNKPFRDLAWGLASNGVAVLRYDKRTKVYAARMSAKADSITVKEEVIDDALAAVELLRRTDGIDPKRVFVLGHSLGGMIAPRIGKADEKIAGLIVLAGPARPLEDVLLEQLTYLASIQGPTTADTRKEIEKIKQQVASVKSPKLSAKTPASSLPLGVPASYWLDLRGYKPAEDAKSLKQPMLILQGGRDYQVTEADLKLWQDALSSRKDVICKLYLDLNHLFATGKGKAVPDEYMKPGHVSEAVVTDIAGWVKGR